MRAVGRFVAVGVLLVSAIASGAEPATASRRTTYSVEYRVRISAKDPSVARVRWNFTGIDEIVYLRVKLDKSRFYDFTGTGTLEEKDNELRWVPGSPYAHLEYRVRLRHRRSKGKGFDSYSDDDWIITRAKSLFPAVRVAVEHDIEPNPVPRCQVVFELPKGWESHSTMTPLSSHSYRPEISGRFLDRPNGWIALGRLDVIRKTLGDTEITIAKAPSSRLDSRGYIDLYAKAFPEFRKLLLHLPERLLIVSGPDPMWRGGISGRNSFYVHGDRPVRTPDRTSPALHELFHVLAPFRPADDGRWVTEGLAEYYSLAIQLRIGAIRERDFHRGLRLFERYGDWNVNLAARRDLAATNNSAPLIVYAIDRAIQERTGAERGLDQVVRDLTERGEKVSTAGFLRAVNAASRHNFTSFFQRHVYAGLPPKLDEQAPSSPKPKSRDGSG